MDGHHSAGRARIARWGSGWGVAAIFFAASLALRVPFRSELAYHWDSAQFALAVENFEMGLGQPHAPGFFLYVMLGRVMNWFVGEPHASLVWLSVIAGAALPAIGYWLGAAMFGRGCGIATGAVLATSPLCWFHSEIALTTIVDGALVCATVLAGWVAIQHGGRWRDVVVLAALLAGVAGNRPQTAPVLLPVWFYFFSQFAPSRGRKLVAGVTLAVLLVSLWFIPMVRTTGGLRMYLELIAAKAQFDSPKTAWGGGLGAVTDSLQVVGASCWMGLLLATPAAVVGVMKIWKTQAARVVWWWLLPMAAFGVFVYTTMPGYVLNYFPALALLAGAGIGRWSEKTWLRLSLISAVAILDVVAFAARPGWMSAHQIREQDRALEQCLEVIRATYAPEEVVICHRGQFFFWSFRQFQYHLPEYRSVLLQFDESLPGERGHKFWVGHHRRLQFVESVPAGRALLVVPPGESVAMFGRYFDVSQAHAVQGTAGRVYAW